MSDLAIIVLNYRTPELTEDCLASLATEVDRECRVVVVDNASGDGSADRIEGVIARRGWNAWASVLRAPVNGGFAAGNNLAIRSIEAEAYLLLNSDTLVRPGAIRSLRDAAHARADAGIVGAGLLTARGDPAESYFRFVAPLSELLRGANSGPITRLLHAFDPTLPPTDAPREVDWVGFACALIRRQVVREIGLLDDGYFMYFEDMDYCRRARQAGWKVVYWPAAKVVHLLGGSSRVTQREILRKRAPRYYYEARARYFAKFYGRIGLWSANALWHLGRMVSLSRELLGRPASHRDGEARDLWTNAWRPLRVRQERRT